MGYDFKTCKRPDRCPPGYVPLYASSPDSYQLTGTGMELIGEALEAAGLLDTTTEEPDLSSVWPPPELDEDAADEFLDYFQYGDPLSFKPSEKDMALAEAAIRRLEAMLAKPSEQKGKIPSFKFSSNSGWLVTPDECRSMSAVLAGILEQAPSSLTGGPTAKRFGDGSSLKTIREWMMYCEVAADAGGFRVT